MNLVSAFINKVKETGFKNAVRTTLQFLGSEIPRKISAFFTFFYSIPARIDFRFNRKALTQSKTKVATDYEKIREEFITGGFEIEDYEITKDDFTHWLNEVNFPAKYAEGYGKAFTEKALEHYLSSKLLDLNENDVFIDVAAASSPWYDMAGKRYKCKSYAIDLRLPKNNTDPRLIQCDATRMPFAEGSVTKMALHCAYEMFENDADTNLIKEANRVLGKGGRMIILPLYMDHFYYILSNPKANRSGVVYGKAKRVWRDDKYRTRFDRHYSVEAFKERVADYKDKLKLKLYYFTNGKQMQQNIDDIIYIKFAACFTKG
jgi:SAM-dependent methyltransferase